MQVSKKHGVKTFCLSTAKKGRKKTCVTCGAFVALSETHRRTDYKPEETVKNGHALTVDECIDIAVCHKVLCLNSSQCLCSDCKSLSITDYVIRDKSPISDSSNTQKLVTYASIIRTLVAKIPKPERTRTEQSERVKRGKKRREFMIESLSDDEILLLSRKRRSFISSLAERLNDLLMDWNRQSMKKKFWT